MRQRELLDFRTPQHPSLGTNNWGGASPLLARNIPKESLEQRYLKLNSLRTRDEIFLAADGEYFSHLQPQVHDFKHANIPPTDPGWNGKGFLWKFLSPWTEKATLGSKLKKDNRWFPKWNPRNRWPQGWC